MHDNGKLKETGLGVKHSLMNKHLRTAYIMNYTNGSSRDHKGVGMANKIT